MVSWALDGQQMLLLHLRSCYFTQGVNADFEEKLASINHPCGRSKPEIFSKKLRKHLIQYKLKWNLLRHITIDDAKFRKHVETKGV